MWRKTLPALLAWNIFKWPNGKIDIHKFTEKDELGFFHTHVGYAIRVILWGGYVEELEDGRHRTWFPGMIGIITPDYCHRVAGLRNGRISYSLWIRFKKRAIMHLRINHEHHEPDMRGRRTG